MDIEVLFFGSLRQLATRQCALSLMEGAQLSDLIERLCDEYGTDFRNKVDNIRGRILINGQDYEILGGMDAPLKGEDTVVFLDPIAGG